MTRLDAHRLLNAVRCGADASQAQIRAALIATGDISRPYRKPQLSPVPQQMPRAISTVPSFLNRSTRVMRPEAVPVDPA